MDRSNISTDDAQFRYYRIMQTFAGPAESAFEHPGRHWKVWSGYDWTARPPLS